MRKSLWLEWMEWMVLGLILLLLVGVLVMQKEITSVAPENPLAPVESLPD